MRATPSSTSSRSSWNVAWIALVGVSIVESACAWSPTPLVSPACGGPALAAGDGPRCGASACASGTTVARWRASSRMPASGCARTNSHGERVQQLEAGALLGGVVGCEQRAPAHAEPLDQPRDERRRARALSSSAAALRCSSTKRWMRSRASGGTCGDSVAAARPSDEVELAPPRDLDDARELDLAQLDRRPRRARARRRRRPAGSTSSRSQASTSRTSARLRNARLPGSTPTAGCALRCGAGRPGEPSGGAGAILEPAPQGYAQRITRAATCSRRGYADVWT